MSIQELYRRLFKAPTTALYFEVHITIDPVLYPPVLNLLKTDAQRFGFRVADLLMQKGKNEDAVPAQLDTFITTRGTEYEEVVERTKKFIVWLNLMNFTVRRYKLENTLVDSRTNDEWGLL